MLEFVSRNKVFSMTQKNLLDDSTQSEVHSYPGSHEHPQQPTTNISKNYLIYNNIRLSHEICQRKKSSSSKWGDSSSRDGRARREDDENWSSCCSAASEGGWFFWRSRLGNHHIQHPSNSEEPMGILLFILRFLWMVTFGACLTVAAYMINEVWSQYYDNPVIVTFNPSEENIDAIPFPAVTVCNMNPFSKVRVQEFEKRYLQARTPEERNETLDALRVIYGLCSAQQSFIKSRGFAKQRGFITIPEAAESGPSPDMDKRLNDFLLDNSQSCGQLLRLCEWESQEFQCEDLFRPILTDYGMCCTFNALPQQRMLKEKKGIHNAARLRKNPFWNESEVLEWRKWKYQNSLIINDEQKYPFRQQRAGMMNGLSILVDPDIDNSFCPSADSEGIKILLHAPIEAPRVADLGSIVGLNREAFLQVSPDVTISDPGIADYDHEKRNCYFGKEYKLNFYKPYTKANCQEECWNNILLKTCKCVMYYTPRHVNTNVCSFSPSSDDYKCVRKLEAKMFFQMDKDCGHCIYSCNNLAYTTEVTSATLQSSDVLWEPRNYTSTERNASNNGDWMHHRISIVHIYMGSDTVVPKLRRKLYNTIDLIANTGGLLGLSLGFSILSAVEICYVVIIRLCKKCVIHGSRYYYNSNRYWQQNQDSSSPVKSNQQTRMSRTLLHTKSNKVHNILKSNKNETESPYQSKQFCRCFDA